MKWLLFITTLCVGFSVAAADKETPKPEHREHGAHVHGAAELSIAFDGPRGKIEFKSPSESLFGFEHAAKSAADKKSQNDALTKFETNIADMIAFDKALNCKITKDKIEVVFEGAHHSDTTAAFSVQCDKSPTGTKIVFNIQKYFPKLKDVDAQMIADAVQKSAEIKNSGQSVELK